MLKKILSTFMLAAIVSSSYSQKQPRPFQKGDRIVFAGNSITEAGFYLSYIWLYYMVHYPNSRIEVINGGVGGDVAEQIYRRLDGDLLPNKPSKLIVSFGMNDSKYFEYTDKEHPMTEEKRAAIVETSYKSFEKIEDKLKQHPEISPIIMASSPYEETVQQKGDNFKGKAITMSRIVDFQKKAAAKQNWAFVDLFHPMTAINEKQQKKDPSYTSTGPDRIHPGSAGHFIMAYIFLKDQGLAGNPVANFTVNAKNKKVIKAENCTVSNVQSTGQQLSFDYLAKSLPFPYDTVARAWGNDQIQTDALKAIPFVKDFDQEILSVKGITSGNYVLKVDQANLGTYSSDELNKGINLAMIKASPAYQQALQIMDLNSTRKNIEAKFRNYFWVQYDFLYDKGLLFNTTKAAEDTIQNNLETNGWLKAKYEDYELVKNSSDSLKAEMKTLVDKIYTINQPKNRHIELIKQS